MSNFFFADEAAGMSAHKKLGLGTRLDEGDGNGVSRVSYTSELRLRVAVDCDWAIGPRVENTSQRYKRANVSMTEDTDLWHSTGHGESVLVP